jgi:hypothetical protein
MVARLGNVLYWTGCLVVVLILGALVYAWAAQALELFNVPVLLIIAVLIWLFGLACRYVLGGPQKSRNP